MKYFGWSQNSAFIVDDKSAKNGNDATLDEAETLMVVYQCSYLSTNINATLASEDVSLLAPLEGERDAYLVILNLGGALPRYCDVLDSSTRR